MQDGAEYDRRGNRKKYQKPGYNLDRRTYEVDDGTDRLEQQVLFGTIHDTPMILELFVGHPFHCRFHATSF